MLCFVQPNTLTPQLNGELLIITTTEWPLTSFQSLLQFTAAEPLKASNRLTRVDEACDDEVCTRALVRRGMPPYRDTDMNIRQCSVGKPWMVSFVAGFIARIIQCREIQSIGLSYIAPCIEFRSYELKKESFLALIQQSCQEEEELKKDCFLAIHVHCAPLRADGNSAESEMQLAKNAEDGF